MKNEHKDGTNQDKKQKRHIAVADPDACAMDGCVGGTPKKPCANALLNSYIMSPMDIYSPHIKKHLPICDLNLKEVISLETVGEILLVVAMGIVASMLFYTDCQILEKQ